MRLTNKQTYVLAHLERVLPRPYKHAVSDPYDRYQFDGADCTAQITGLVVRGAIVSGSGHRLRRRT